MSKNNNKVTCVLDKLSADSKVRYEQTYLSGEYIWLHNRKMNYLVANLN